MIKAEVYVENHDRFSRHIGNIKFDECLDATEIYNITYKKFRKIDRFIARWKPDSVLIEDCEDKIFVEFPSLYGWSISINIQ